MHVAPEFRTLGDAAHRRNHAVTDHDRADVPSLALGDELLQQDILLGALSALQELDDHRGSSETLDRRQHVLSPTDELGRRDADVVARQELQAAQLVA